jgi:hypothetical protein
MRRAPPTSLGAGSPPRHQSLILVVIAGGRAQLWHAVPPAYVLHTEVRITKGCTPQLNIVHVQCNVAVAANPVRNTGRKMIGGCAPQLNIMKSRTAVSVAASRVLNTGKRMT